MGVFDEWDKLEITSGLTQADVLRNLNEACGTKYKSNWIAQQQNSVQGITRTPQNVRRYMMEKVLRAKLAKYGIKDNRIIQHLLNALT